MINKHMNIFYYLLGALDILLGLLMIQATRDISLPRNTQKEGFAVRDLK